jgi:L-seryl-tRNA(Ser) seleniumtransferase
MRVHPSNYRVEGFTEEVGIKALAELAGRHRLLSVDDLGSGALIDFRSSGLGDEPCVRDSIEAGADLVCFSGDKLVGGPQAGIIVGKKHLIDQLDAHPLMRTYRVGKLTLLAMEATLRHYLDADDALDNIPALAMLRANTDRLAKRANELVEQLQNAVPDERFLLCSDVSYAGGGAMPGRALSTVVIEWRPERISADHAMTALREGEVPVIARVRGDAVCFDLRTIRPLDFDALVAAVYDAAWSDEEEPERDGTPLPVL